MKDSTKWLVAGLVILVVIATAVGLNISHENNLLKMTGGVVDTDNGDLKINWDRYPTTDVVLSDALEITNAGTYHLTGSLMNDGIQVDTSNGPVRLILDNVSISNSKGPAIVCYAADDLVIELIGKNTLSDSDKYSADYDEEVNGAIYSVEDLTFQGEGSLDLTANYQDGIVGKDDLKFNSGTYNISAVDDGIRGKDSVYIVDGEFAITAVGDGIKSTNETDTGKGFVLIEKGDIEISAGDDGIHAIRKLIINGGNLEVTKSYEGLEAQVIAINAGNVSVTSSDDGLNAGGGSDAATTGSAKADPFAGDENCILSINGGTVYVNASGDGIDSNGWLYFNGGTVVVDGPTNNGNGALDAGLGIMMSGGKVIAVGSSGMAESLGTGSSVYSASIYFNSTQAAGTTIEIRDTSGKTVASHTAAKAFNHLAVGTEEFQPGAAYTIYLNGEEYQEFTVAEIVTVVGNGGMNGGPGGGNTPQVMPGRR